MKNLKEIYRQYFWLIVIAAVIVAAGTVYWLAGKHQEHKVDNAIQQSREAAKAEVNSAAISETTAANTSIERRTEDSVRDAVIRPKLENARRNADRSRSTVDKAKERLNEKPQISNTDTWADNCRRLERVFPDTEFEYCKDR